MDTHALPARMEVGILVGKQLMNNSGLKTKLFSVIPTSKLSLKSKTPRDFVKRCFIVTSFLGKN